MNCGLHPSLIEKNQLSFASNLTVRGGYARNRPPVTRQLQISWQSDAVRQAVQSGLFQGACVYLPDFGSSSLITAISGRLYKWTVTGSVVTVLDVTPENDPNPSTTTQVWMWQSEKWVIVNNGQDLPLFFDGTTTRRSYGPSIELASVVSTNPVTTPEIGSVFTATLSAPWTGPYDVPVLFHGEYYQPLKNAVGYAVDLTTLYNKVTTDQVIGSSVLIQPALVGYLTSDVTWGSGPINITLNLSVAYAGLVGDLLSISNAFHTGIWIVTAISGSAVSVRSHGGSIFANSGYIKGTAVQVSGSSANNVEIGQLNDVVPYGPVGAVNTVTLTRAFTGTAGTVVTINGSQYSIQTSSNPPDPAGPNELYLVNLSDASGVDISALMPLPILSVPELPAGRMGAYGLGQNWMSLVDGKQFIVGDISRSASGTQANDYRDAVLKTTEITFGGGSFAIPSAGGIITTMIFTSKLDESLGQGPLQIGTNVGMFAISAPFDFQNPPAIGTPILPEVLKGNGPISHDGTIQVNSDTLFRTVDGIGTFIQARRDFTSWGNAGISDEMNERILDLDNQELLYYGSAIEFDNRTIVTANPQVSPAGVIHLGLVVKNDDPVSSLSGKSSSVYDGLWTGLNVLKLLVGLFDGRQRAFAFGYNVTTRKIELYEFLTSRDSNQNDNGYIPITWGFETATLFREQKPPDQLMRLLYGHVTVDKIFGTFRVRAWYRFDDDCWHPWADFSICATGTAEQQRPRLSLGEPSGTECNTATNKPAREGYLLQVKFQFTGRGRFLGARFEGCFADEEERKAPICGIAECRQKACYNPAPDFETYSLQTNIHFNGTPITQVINCPSGSVCPENYTYPDDTVIVPNPPDANDPNPPVGNPNPVTYYVMGCLSPIAYQNTPESLAAMYAELLRQAAFCHPTDPGNINDGNGNSGGGGSGPSGGGGPPVTPNYGVITLSDLV